MDFSLAPSRSKKPRVDRVNDENADPNVSLDAANGVRYEGSHDLDDLEDPFVTSIKRPRYSRACQPEALATRNRKSTISAKAIIYADIVLKDTDLQEPIQVPTPQTPRHRDAFSKKIPITPRRLLTPAGKRETPRTPRTPVTPTHISTVYQDARQAFVRSVDPGRLIGRDTERNELDSFIRGGISRRTGRGLYVSGPPGTGKSALVREVCQNLADGPGLQQAFINCMSVKTSGDVYETLVKDLLGDFDASVAEQNGDLYDQLAPKAKSPGPIYLVVLDEMDHLLDLDLDVLYNLFELALRRTSRLILIGIANALDLTDRFLPRLKARNLKPRLLPFLPYTAPQVASVITAKLRTLLPKDEDTQLEFVPFVHPTAIEFCSKKVASRTGDLRKAFDIIHRALALVEDETKQKQQREVSAPMSTSKSPLSENPNLSSPSKPRTLAASLAAVTPMNAPRATIAHIARISASALGHGTSQRLQTLNLQQKAALCALIHLEKQTRSSPLYSVSDTPSKSSINSSPTIRHLYGSYSSLCKRDNTLHPLTAVEFCDVIGGLETLGLVGDGEAMGTFRRMPGKKPVMREDKRVSCWVSEQELESCLDGAGGGILKGLLANVD
ncbi:MAG: hypothetical protein Q9208_007716 [Pyrenodesmia sp. 3 TL-2023]